MSNETTGLSNINFLTKTQYNSITQPSNNELYCVEAHIVIESYIDDSGNWYRKYSDGWVEQGGKPTGVYNTYTYLVPMRDNNYFCIASYNSGKSSYFYASDFYYNHTSTSISCLGPSAGNAKSTDWYVCGYAL